MSGPEPALKDFIKLCEDPDAFEQLKKDAPTEWRDEVDLQSETRVRPNYSQSHTSCL
jgi:hypothetical protein